MQYITSKHLRLQHYILLGAIFHTPQIYHYITLILKKKQDKLKTTLKTILQIPVILMIGGTTFFLPFMTTEIPFLKNIKETWKYNYYPTLYINTVYLIHDIYVYYNTYKTAIKKQNFRTEFTEKDG